MTVKVVVTPWVTHEGGPIFSLDVSPREHKLATCGIDDRGEGIVIIWNSLPMVSQRHGEQVKNSTPLLARIPMPSGVNAVRWSRCGRYFAVASDDRSVSVWEYGGRLKSAGTIGQRKEETNLEAYKCRHILHGHSMEVLAVEWSWDGRYLASASIDNTVVVWNALKFPERVVVLDASRDGHMAPVKGLSFDPIGKYLATQSEDKTLKVWSMENWTCEAKISDPFEESAQSTMFMRPEWSPDGRMLVAPCAMNNGGPTAQLIMRGSWDASKDLVGHRRAVTVVRCSPRCFEYEDAKGHKSKISLYAVGSRDKSLSVWALPGLTRPIVVLHNFFKHSIMDASWKDATLFCCSQDGSVKTLIFEEKAVGRMLRLQEMSDLCYDLYRTRPKHYAMASAENGGMANGGEGAMNGGSPTKGAFIETAADLAAARLADQPPRDTQKESLAREREEAEQRAKAEAELLEKRKEQVEARSKDGKRRIQPVFICSTIDNSVPEKGDDAMEVDDQAEGGGAEAAAARKVNHPTTISVNAKNGLQATASSASDSTAEESSGISSESGSSSDSDGSSEGEEEREQAGGGGDSGGVAGGKRRKLNNRDRLLLADFSRPVLRPLERLQKDSLTLAAAELRPRLLHPISGVKHAFLAAHNEWTNAAGVRAARVERVRGNEDGSAPSMADLEEASSSEQQQHHQQERGGASAWTTFMPSAVLVMTANSKWAVLSCADCSLHVLSSATGVLLFRLQLDSLPAQLGLQETRAYVLTSNGYFSCWDLACSSALFSRIPVLDIVSNDVHLHSISLSPSGAPLISFTNGASYTYSAPLQAWFVVDAASSLSRLSSEALAGDDVGGGAIARVIRAKKRPGVAPTASLATRNWVGQAQMEGWLFAALDARSMDDLRPMTARYTDMLVMTKSRGKLRELLGRLDEWVRRAEAAKRAGAAAKPEDAWMDEEKMRQMKEMVRRSIAADTRVADVLQEMEDEGKMIF